MKIKTILLLVLSCFLSKSEGQILGGYQLQDHLVSAIHPDCDDAIDNFVTGPPDDSTWVNLPVNSIMTGLFSSSWSNGVGEDLLLEASFHAMNCEIRLLLSDNTYSSSKMIAVDDWTSLSEVAPWIVIFNSSCDVEDDYLDDHLIVALDFLDFGLSPGDQVSGLEITFLETVGAPDLAGVYIIQPEVPCGQVDLGSDTTLCENLSMLLNPTGFDSYVWNDQSTDSTLQIVGSDLGTGTYIYSVEVVDSLGCYSTDSISITFTICASTQEIDNTQISFFPNPVSDFLNVAVKTSSKSPLLEIYTITGVKVGTYIISGDSLEIDVTAFSGGIYFGKIGDFYFKFFKE